MKNFIAKQRAVLTATSIIDSRSLELSHRRLHELLQPKMSVLDVGCGTGGITNGIASAVGSNGVVLGIDNNQELIQTAKEKYNHVTNLSFRVEDLYQLNITEKFDVISCARVLQWIDNPLLIILQLKELLVKQGKLVILDYNHMKIEWSPNPPPAFLHFYNQFMKWRADAGMDNAIADKLEKMFIEAELTDIKVTEQHELATMSEHNFFDKVNMWSNVMASRGLQMLNDGFISEKELNLAKQSYLYWLHNNATSQKLYLLSVEGIKKHST